MALLPILESSTTRKALFTYEHIHTHRYHNKQKSILPLQDKCSKFQNILSHFSISRAISDLYILQDLLTFSQNEYTHNEFL